MQSTNAAAKTPWPAGATARHDCLTEAPTFPGDAADGSEAIVTAPTAQEDVAQGWRVLGILSALMGFASISTDLYLPAIPEMGHALHAGPGQVEFTISGYLVGFSLGQLVWGPVGDRYGRRLPVALGLVLFVIGSAGCAMSGSGWVMIAWRIVQALGACASVVLARAMVRDLYTGHRAAEMMSTLMTVMAIAPLLGPILGGQILALSGWRAIFWTLVGVGIATLAALFTLKETLPDARRNPEPMAIAFARYGQLLQDRRLLAYAGAGGFFYAGTFAYIAGTPSVYISYFHVPAQFYGLLFGTGIVGIMATNLLNAWTVRRVGSDRLLRLGSATAMVAALALAVDARTGWGGLAGVAVPLFLFIAMAGLIVANSIAGALALYPGRAGAVSALVGSIQYGSGIVGSALVGAFADGTPWTMAWVIALCGVGSLLSALFVPSPPRPQ